VALFVDAQFSASTHGWQWPQNVALPAGSALARGSYRLWVMARSANGSVLGRAASTWTVSEPGPVALNDTLPAPSNDLPANASLIFGASGSSYGSNDNAGCELPDGTPSNGNANVWWKWKAPQSGTVTFDTKSSNFDTFLIIFTADSSVGGGFLDVADDNDSGGNLTSLASFKAEAGRDYLIAVSGATGGTGSIAWNWNQVASPVGPPNDNIAIAISGESGSVTGTTVGATGDWPDSNNPAANVWWVWTAPRSGTVTFDTNGSNYATYVNAYSNSKALIIARPSAISFAAVAGQKYFISVSGVAAAVGAIKLNWSMASANDVGGRVLDKAGKGIAGGTVFLIPGGALNPIVVPQEGGPPPYTHTSADGSYSFFSVAVGTYAIIAVKSGVSFSLLYYTFTKTTSTRPQAGADFHLSTLDSTGPEVFIASVSRSVVNGTDVPTGATGTVRDFNDTRGQTPAGVLGVVYALQKLNDDAANLLLPPGRRAVTSIFSKKARGFVPYVPGPPLNNDKTFIIGASNFDWSTHFTADVQKALASPGTYRLLVFAVDRAFNLSRNPSTSTSPDSPAGASYTLAHFIVRPAHLAVTRTLPISAPNGSLITYLISVSNTGDLPLENVSAIETLNTNKTRLQNGTISPAPSAINAFGVTWKFATLGAHQTQILTLKVKASEGNPFGSNIKAGQLDVSSNGGVARFDHDQISIESSTWLIGGFLNALRGAGDAIGRTLSHGFGSSRRDQQAEADLNSIKAGTGVTRVAGADALRFGNGVTLVATGGGNLVASGGGNLVASGGGNLVSIAGIRGASILSQLSSDPASLLSSTSLFAPALGGANLVAPRAAAT